MTIVEPGAFRTDFNGRSLAVPDRLIDDYASTSSEFLNWIQDMDLQYGSDKIIYIPITPVDPRNFADLHV